MVTGSAIGSNLGMLFHFSYRERTCSLDAVWLPSSVGFNAPIPVLRVLRWRSLLLELAVRRISFRCCWHLLAGAITTDYPGRNQVIFSSERGDPFSATDRIHLPDCWGSSRHYLTVLSGVSNYNGDGLPVCKAVPGHFIRVSCSLSSLFSSSLYGGVQHHTCFSLNDMDVIADQSFFGLKVQGTTLYFCTWLLLLLQSAGNQPDPGGRRKRRYVLLHLCL